MPITRAEANAIAVRAVRAILDGADQTPTMDLSVEDRPVHVELSRGPAPTLPIGGLLGVDVDRDGPVPRSVRARATWDGGAATLEVRLDWWRGGTYRTLVGIGVYVASSQQTILWNTPALAIGERDESTATTTASFASFKRKGDSVEDANARAWSLYEAVQRSGLPLATKWNIEWFRMRLPGGEIEPDAASVLRRSLHIALLKLPYFVRGEQKGIEGAPPFAIRPALATRGAVEEHANAGSDGRRDGLWPLPGGVREYKTTLDDLVAEVARSSPSEEAFFDYLARRYEVTGGTSRVGYRNLLAHVGLVAIRDDGMMNVTEAGRAYLAGLDPVDLFERLHAAYSGLLDVLVIVQGLGRAGSARLGELLPALMGTTWETDNQVNFRRNWLLSLGMTDRAQEGDALTELGTATLARHATETDATRARLNVLLDSSGPRPGNGAAPSIEDAEPTPGLDDAVPAVVGAPSAWYSDRLSLSVERLAPHVAQMALPPVVLDRAIAALASGKHLLLIGPPGTGKTEMARGLCSAAASDGYCTGAFFATASADWTTFDTIGGYALQKDHSLRFRSGALLRAIEKWQWLVIDELNRADVDRAFGELMSVLAGGRTDAPYELEDGHYVSIGPDPNATHRVPKTFRVIATMNTWDKTSLFRLSYAVQRRFAIVYVGVPDDAAYRGLIERHAIREGNDPPLDADMVTRLAALFSTAGLFASRPIGPAVAIDIVRYLRRRAAGGNALAESLAMFLLPQLEGLDSAPALDVFRTLTRAVGGTASREQHEELVLRFADLFPHVTLPSA